MSWDKLKQKWYAKATLKGKRINLGIYAVEVDAARAYDNWAKDFADKELNIRECLTPFLCPTSK